METDYNHLECIYWVFTQLCNDQCDHCYNLSGPQGNRISEEECLAIVENLPDKLDRIILSGGEPLAERKKLYLILDEINKKYGQDITIILQTNGDLLNGKILDTLLEKRVKRISIASMDRYHKKQGERKSELEALFQSRGMGNGNEKPIITKSAYQKFAGEGASYGFWGADEGMWLGGNWARGRAMQKNIWYTNPNHNFCAILSGGIGFLTGHEDIPQELSIQLWKVNPCCPGTKFPMGDARTEKVANVLQKVSKSAIFQKINEGDPLKMGESIGVPEAYAKERTQKLKNICLWCDEFFEKHYDMEKLEAGSRKTEDRSS